MTKPITIKEVFQLLNQCPIFRLNEAVEEIIEHIDELEQNKCTQINLIYYILYSIPIQYERLSVKTKDKMHLILKSYKFCNALSKS